MTSKKLPSILCVVMSLVFIALFWNTVYAQEETIIQRQADLKNALETRNLKVWRDYFRNYQPTQEEEEYTNLLSITPDQLVIVPLEPNFALEVQEILTAAMSPRPVPRIGGENILLVTYSFTYGAPLWWGLFLGRPWSPPAEFDLDFKLRIHLLNTVDASFVAYPQHNYSGNTYKRDNGLEELFNKVQEDLSSGTPDLRDMIKRACKEIHRVVQVVDGESAGLEENLRRQVAKIGIQDENWEFRQRAIEILVNTLKPEDIEILSKLLYDEKMDVRLSVVHKLTSKLTDPLIVDTFGAAFVPLFRLAILDEISYVRRSAAEGLGETNSPEALEPLFIAVRDENYSVRKYAAVSLGQLGDPKAVDILINLFEEESDVQVREAATLSLGQLGDPKAKKILIRLLDDPSSLVDRAAATSLKKLDWKPPTVQLQVKYLLATRKTDDLVALGKPAIELLIRALESSNTERIQVSAESLGRIADRAAIEPLLVLLVHDSPSIRVVAAQALGDIGNTRAVVPLIALLKDESKDARLAAVRALGDIGDEQAKEPLAKLLKDTDEDVRSATGEVLKELNWEPEDPEAKVLFLFFTGDTTRVIQMGKMATKTLTAMLADESEKRRVEAIRHLGQLGKDASAAVESICKFLQSESREERIVAASALASIGDLNAAEAIQKALESQKDLDGVSLWMRYALVRLVVERDRHIRFLVKALSSDLGSLATELISMINLEAEEIELVFEMLLSPDSNTRIRTTKILAQVGGSTVVDRLWKALASEENADVRKAIRKAIRDASLKKRE